MTTCREEIEKFGQYLASIMTITELDESSCMVHFPFRDPSSDYISVLVVKSGNNLILSDYGSSFSYLRDHGLRLTDKRRNIILRSLKNKTGANVEENELIMEVEDPALLNMALIDFIHGIQDVKSNVNLVRARNPFRSDFKSEVNNVIIGEWGLEPLIDQQIEGKSGKKHTVDFVFSQHHVYFDTVTTVGRSMGAQRLMTLLPKVIDLRAKFSNGHQFFIGLDDRDGGMEYWPSYNREILRLAGSTPFFWEEEQELLASVLGVDLSHIEFR